MIITCALINSSTSLVENTIVVDTDGDYEPPEGYILVEIPTGLPVNDGWHYVNDEFVAPPQAPLTDAQIIANNTAMLQQVTQLSTAQKNALTVRVGTLNDAIELDIATPGEIAELPIRTAQLKAWKTYAVYLGRVTAQSGWALTVVWPTQPVDGMDLSVSATTPEIV